MMRRLSTAANACWDEPLEPTDRTARSAAPWRRPPRALLARIARLALVAAVLAVAAAEPAARPVVATAPVGPEQAAAVGPQQVAPVGPEQATAAHTYVLQETWSEVAPPEAALFLDPQDLSSDPAEDGPTVVLARSRRVADPMGAEGGWSLTFIAHGDGAPVGLVPLADALAPATRVDVGFDGTVHVLGRLGDRPGTPWGVLRVAPDRTIAGAFPLLVDGAPSDVAVAPDGRVYVSMAAVAGGPDEITVYDASGRLLDRIVPPERGADDRYGYELARLDVDAGGVIYVIARAIRPCPPDVNPPNPPRPPTPTPRPSMARGGDVGSARPATTAPNQQPPTPDFPCQKDVVLVFEPDHAFREEVPNPHTTDIAVGASGVFVSTSDPFRRPAQRVYPLGEEAWAYRFPMPDRLDVPVELSTSMLQLDVTHAGALQAVSNLGEPFYRGAIRFGVPDGAALPGPARPMVLGTYDRPALGGPNNPRRLDARDELLVLEAPYQRYGPEGQANTAVEITHDAAGLQRWTLEGRPYDQWVQHDNVLRDGATGSDLTNSVHPVVDVALDGDHAYAVSTQVVWRRARSAPGLPPDWYRRVPGAYFMAVSADADRVAILNATVERVLVLDASGWPLFDRPIFQSPARHLLSDLALYGERVYIADEGRHLILVRHIDGTDLGQWSVPDGPRAVSVDRDGDVYVLGRGGAATRHRPDGTLVASWRVPSGHDGVPVDGQDIAPGDDGRVYVTFVGVSDPPAGADRPGGGRGYDIDAGGIWVFVPQPASTPPRPPIAAACAARPDKESDPKIVLLGEEVDVRLLVDGRCPGRQVRQQLFIVLDTSWSMHDNYYPGQRGPGALTRAKAFLSRLLLQLDPALVDVGLVTFSNGAGVEMPLPSAVPDVRSRILSRIADGDTQMGAGVALAHAQLRGAGGDPSVPQTILIVSDGVFKDDPESAVAAARGDGIRVKAIVLSTPEFDPAAEARLGQVLDGEDHILVDPVPEIVSAEIARLVAYVPNPGLFETIRIDDVVPDNMTYLEGSAEPPAVFDASSRTLTWRMGPVAADEPIRLRYRLRPRETGTWPTNVVATADYVDALGNPGSLLFPVPWVLVLSPDPLATATPTPTVTPTAAPPRTWTIYLPIAYREPRCVPKTFYSDIALVLDMSTSMDRVTEAGRMKREAALSAAARFVKMLELEPNGAGGHHQVAVVGFNNDAWTAAPLTNDRDAVLAALDGLPASVREGTRLDLAFAEGQRALEGPGRKAENRPVLVLLTDGLPNRVPTPAPIGGQEDTVLEVADRVKAAGTTVYTIGLGEHGDVLDWMLQRAASDPSMFYETPDAEDLAAIYRRILVRIRCE